MRGRVVRCIGVAVIGPGSSIASIRLARLEKARGFRAVGAVRSIGAVGSVAVGLRHGEVRLRRRLAVFTHTNGALLAPIGAPTAAGYPTSTQPAGIDVVRSDHPQGLR